MAAWDDPIELGKRLRAARVYAGEDQATYGPRVGVSGRTLAKMEKGETGSLGKSPAVRKQVAEAAVEAGAPPEFFGLDELQGVTRSDLEDLLAEQRRELEANSADPPAAPDADEGG